MQYKALPKNPQDKSYPIEVKNNQKRSFAWAIVLIMILLVLIIILGIFIWKGESILNSLFG
jgi:ATP-dependent Zn protease